MRVKKGFCQSAVTVPMSTNATPVMSRALRSCADVSGNCFMDQRYRLTLDNNLPRHVVVTGAALDRAAEIKCARFVRRDRHGHSVALNDCFIDAEFWNGEPVRSADTRDFKRHFLTLLHPDNARGEFPEFGGHLDSTGSTGRRRCLCSSSIITAQQRIDGCLETCERHCTGNDTVLVGLQIHDDVPRRTI